MNSESRRTVTSVRRDLKYITKTFLKGSDGKSFRLADFHVEILEAMFEGGYLVVNIPTDHMKSTLGCFIFPILSLIDNPNETHLICGANINDSKRRVQALELELETNKELIAAFPHLAKPTERDNRIWAATQFNVAGRTLNKPNPSVLATAVGSNDLKGRRGKLIMDDIEGEEAIWSPMKREQLRSWLNLEAWRCYEDRKESSRPLLCLLGTPFDVDSIYFSVERTGGTLWKVIRYPVYRREEIVPVPRKTAGRHGYYADNAGKKWQIDYLWPEKKEKVDRARASLEEFNFSIAYRMDPTGGDPTKLSAEQILERLSDAQQIKENPIGFVTLDPATGSKERKADYAGIAVVKLQWATEDHLPIVELQRAFAFKQGLFEQVNLCAQLSAEFGYPVLYEKSNLGPIYKDTFHHLHPEVRLLEHYTSQENKLDVSMGLTVVKTLVVHRRLLVRPEQLRSDGVKKLASEVRDLQPPFERHDHIAAAIWFAVRYVYDRVRQYRGPAIRTIYNPVSPMHAVAQFPSYRDDPTMTPQERAKQAIEYDRAARNPQALTVVGYRAWGRRQEMPWEAEQRKETEKMWEALTKRRMG